MGDDTLVVMIATVLQGLFERGLEVTPRGDGWTIKLATPDSESVAQREQVRSSW